MKWMGFAAFLFVQTTALFGITTIVTNGSSSPVALSNPGNNTVPLIAVSTNGQAFSVWNALNPVQIQGQFYDGTNWNGLQINSAILNPVTPSNGVTFQIAFGSSPKLGIDSVGNATLLFVNPFNQIIALRFSGAVLTSATQLSTMATSNISPQLTVNQSGVALAIWIQNIPFQVLASTFVPIPGGGSWSASSLFLPFAPQTNGTYPASVGLANNNVGVAVWQDGPTGTILSESFTVP